MEDRLSPDRRLSCILWCGGHEAAKHASKSASTEQIGAPKRRPSDPLHTGRRASKWYHEATASYEACKTASSKARTARGQPRGARVAQNA